MLSSIRRIANALLVLSVLSLSVSLVSSLSLSCGEGRPACLATAFSAYPLVPYETDFTLAATTPSVGMGAVTLAEVNAVVQVLSFYVLLVAMGMLVALECLQLHYIRQLFKGASQFRLK